MTLNSLLDLPLKDKLASDTLDLMADQDFELDLRIIVTHSTTLPMANNTNTCPITNCGANCHTNSCTYTYPGVGVSCYGTCTVGCG